MALLYIDVTLSLSISCYTAMWRSLLSNQWHNECQHVLLSGGTSWYLVIVYVVVQGVEGICDKVIGHAWKEHVAWKVIGQCTPAQMLHICVLLNFWVYKIATFPWNLTKNMRSSCPTQLCVLTELWCRTFTGQLWKLRSNMSAFHRTALLILFIRAIY